MTFPTPNDLKAAHRGVLRHQAKLDDAIAERARIAAWLIEHDNVPIRQLAEVCAVSHQTPLNWAKRAKETP